MFKRTNNPKLPYSEEALYHYWQTKEYKYTNRKNYPSKFVRPITMHQLRNAIATYLKNEMMVNNDIVGQILGHKQNKTITDRYGKINYYTTGKYIDEMLDRIFIENQDNKKDINNIEALKELFPNKDEATLLKVIDLLK